MNSRDCEVSCIIAIGSHHGDDQVAWRLADRLESERNANVIKLAEPLQIVDYMHETDRLIVVDACAGGGKPGTVTRFEWPDERIKIRNSHSSHGFDLASALELAEKLCRLPSTVVLFGVEIGQCRSGASLSDEVEKALSELESLVMVELVRGGLNNA